MGIDARILIRRVPHATVTEDWLTETSWALCASIGADKFFTSDGTESHDRERRRAIERTGHEYHQDGDSICAAPGECLLEVNVWSRYYGPGYERGDLLTLCGIAEWLEANIPGCEVWYGGDSSGVLAEPWPDAKRRELRNHLYSDMGRNYFRSWCKRDEYGLPKACSLCPGGVYRGERYGAGQLYASLTCAGCGRKDETRDGGRTWARPKERD